MYYIIGLIVHHCIFTDYYALLFIHHKMCYGRWLKVTNFEFLYRTDLKARWWNTHDSESGISRLEVRAGTTPGGQDILSSTPVHGEWKFQNKLDQKLPTGTRIYTTLTVWNKAGNEVFY